MHGCAQSKEADTLDAEGAATCVAQCVLKCPQGAIDPNYMKVLKANINVVKFMIEHYPQVFFEGKHRDDKRHFITSVQNGFVSLHVLFFIR